MINTRLIHSFTFRLALLYTSLSLGSMVLLLGFIHWATVGYLDRQMDATIEEEITGLAEQYQSQTLVGLLTLIAKRLAHDARTAVYLLTDATFKPIAGNLNAWPMTPMDHQGWTRFQLEDREQNEVNPRAARARTFLLRGGLHLLVGRDIRELKATRRIMLDALTIGFILTAALALGVGWLMSSRGMRRIDAINQASHEIMQGDLSRRIPTEGSGDDFDRLSVNLNRMLERIEQLLAAVRQVSDNIAHDLRTPLTRLRTRLEQARRSDPTQVLGEIDQAIDDTDELLITFNALLRIARIEAGSGRGHFTALNLAHLVQDIAELYEPIATEKGQALRVAGPAAVPAHGDRDLLFQALANLVDNAIKHTPPGTTITLTATTTAGPEIRVADTGPGIPPALHEKVFQRFYRSDASRATPGSGLGLSLMCAVADLHHAQIELADNAPGLRVALILPPH